MNTRTEFVLFYLPWDFDLLGGVDVVVDRIYSGTVGKGLVNGIVGLQTWTRRGIGRGLGDRTFAYLNFPEPPLVGSSKLDKLRYAFTLLRRLPSALLQLQQLGVTVINAHFPTRNLFVLAIAKRFGLWRGRLILSFHGSDIVAIRPSDPVWGLIAAQTDCCTCCSNSLKKQLDDTRLFEHVPSVTIHNGIFCDRNASHLIESVTTTQRYLLNIGNYVEAKGQDQAIRAFAAISQGHPDLKFVLAGGRDSGEWLSKLQDLCISLGIGDRVIFHQNVPREIIPDLICSALALIHTPHREAFGLVLVEAGCLGIPVIANNVGGISEIIDDGVSGILVEPNNQGELTSAIERILKDRSLREQLGAALQRKVYTQFSAEKMCHGYFDVLGTDGD